MKSKILIPFLCLIITSNIYSQETIHAKSKTADIRDGDNFFKSYWTITPEVKPDIYKASCKNGTVTFYTDIDSISFFVVPDSTYNFSIILNKKDTAFIQIVYAPGFLDILTSAGDYNYNDKRYIPEFGYQSCNDKELKNLREKFNLDLIAGDGDDFDKANNIMHWIHKTITYDGSCQNPSSKNSIDLIEICKTENRPLNCRMMATIMNECCLAIGLKSRFITCMPKEIKYNDCHVINIVFVNELNKWVWFDPSFDLYVIDEKDNILSVEEVREGLIINKPMKISNDSIIYNGTTITSDIYLKSYMAKNLYRIECTQVSEYDTETKKEDKHIGYIELLPLDATNQSPQHFEKISERTGMKSKYYKTNNPDLFWAIPVDKSIDIKDVFKTLEASIQAKDSASIMELFNQSDTDFFERTSRKYKNWLALEDFNYNHRLNSVSTNGDTTVAVLFQKTSYTSHELSTTKASWNTIKLIKGTNDWKIVAENERKYAKADFTDLSVELDTVNSLMHGKAIIKIDIIEQGEDNLLLALNRGLKLTSIKTEDGVNLDYEQVDRSIIVPWHTAFKGNENLTITVSFKGSLFNESKAKGYSQVNIGPRGSFASWTTYWYPRLPESFSKSKGRISYLVPAGLTVASNGKLIKKEKVKDKEKHIFEVNTPLDYSFAAAEYTHQEEVVDNIVIGVYFIEEKPYKANLYVDSCVQIIRYLKKLYGMYPFDSYSIVELSSDAVGGLGGSSEQGMNFFSSKFLADSSFNLPLFSHEIGHSWWANWVISADGNVIDEGLAEMTAVFCVENFHGEKVMWDFLKNGTPTFPISANAFFLYYANQIGKDIELGINRPEKDGILHELADHKGQFVYNMLRETIGHEAFVEGLRNVIQHYALKPIKLSELREEWEKTSGTDLKWFFDQWFFRKGAPEFNLNYIIEPKDNSFRVKGNVKQLRDIYIVDAEIALVNGNKKDIKILKITDKETAFDFIVSTKPDTVLFDPDYKIFRWTEEYVYQSLIKKGAALRINKQYDEAIAKLTQLLDKQPDNLEGHYQIARAYQELDKLAEAEQHYYLIIGQYQKTNIHHWTVSWSYINLGQLYEEMGKHEEAKKMYNEALSLPDIYASYDRAQKYLKGEKD